MRDRSFRYVQQAYQSAAPAYDRRHDRAPGQGEGAERLRPARQDFRGLPGRSPDTATSEDLRRFQVHLAKQQIGVATINAAIAALRFFFNVTLERPDLVRHLTTVNQPRRAPVVLSQEEVARLLEAAPGLKYKAALSVAYGAGLRVSEVANLKVSDIDSQRMTLRVEQGKGQRDRYVMLFAATARTVARMVARGAAAGMVVSGPEPGQPDVGPSTRARRPRRGAGGGDRQARLAAHLAAQLRHPPARAERRYSRDPSVARNRHILPATTRSRDGSTIRFILDAARRCSSSGNTPIAGLIWSLFLSLMERSPVSPRG